MIVQDKSKSMAQDLELGLDSDSLNPSMLSMGALIREINLRKRPPFLLRYMMNALENKRQKKLLGWSRPWNKDGMTVFRTHLHAPEMDLDFMEEVQKLFWKVCSDMPDEYREFAASLFKDPLRMAFTFYHNHLEGGNEYEGLTLSLGRRVAGDKTKRDRIDIILEDLRVNGCVDNQVDRVRIIVNPFLQWAKGEKWSKEIKPIEADATINSGIGLLYSSALEFYRRYRDDPDRQWNHWAIKYIEYFGPRTFIPLGSAFV